MKKDWLKDIHDRMADYEADEPLGLWDDICSAESKTAVGIHESRMSKVLPWIWSVSAVAACALLFWFLGPAPMQHQQPAVAPDLNAAATRPGKTSRYVQHNVVPDVASAATPIAEPLTDALPPGRQSGVAEEEAAPLHQTTALIADPDSLRPSPSEHTQEPQSIHPRLAHIDKTDRAAQRLTVGFSTAGGSVSSSHQSFYGGHLSVASALNESEWVDSPLLGIMALNRGIETERNVTHHAPIRTGLSLAYRIRDRWSLGSGITYALVSSEIQEGSTSNYLREEQTLHYVGIPLVVIYRAYSWGNFDLYVSPDILAEQCVYGVKDRNFFISGKSQETATEHIQSRPLQLSFGAKLGLQYNLNSFLSIYAEPGCRYYVDDRSSLSTAFKDHPFDFNLNLGVRVTVGN